MTAATSDVGHARTPWHLWAVGVLSFLWNAFGGYDYAMSHLQGDAYMRAMGMSEAQITFMAAYPTWMHAVWAVGVWGSVLGSVLLLARSRWAPHAFAVSLAGLIVSLVYNYLLSNGHEVMGQQGTIMNAVILVACVALTAYAWAMGKRGALR